MAATPVINITIPQGTTFSETFTSTESDGSITNLTGYTGSASLKKWYGSSTKTDFSVSITVGTGEVAITLTSTQTAAIEPGRYYYDVRLESSGGSVSRLVEGMALVRAGITTG